MAGKREKRRQERLAKKKKSRAKARTTRSGPRKTRSDAWPVGDCYASSTWHERGATVHAAFSRAHSDGRMVASFFELDLAAGTIQASRREPLNEATFHGEIGVRTREDETLFQVEPGLVVRIVQEVERYATDEGVKLPKSLTDATALFGDTEPTTDTIPVGPEPPPEPAKPGFFARLFGG